MFARLISLLAISAVAILKQGHVVNAVYFPGQECSNDLDCSTRICLGIRNIPNLGVYSGVCCTSNTNQACAACWLNDAEDQYEYLQPWPHVRLPGQCIVCLPGFKLQKDGTCEEQFACKLKKCPPKGGAMGEACCQKCHTPCIQGHVCTRKSHRGGGVCTMATLSPTSSPNIPTDAPVLSNAPTTKTTNKHKKPKKRHGM